MIALVAKVPFKFHGRNLAVGEVFDGTALEAVTLRASRQAGFAPVDASKPKRKRVYKRRDLRAEE